MCSIRLCTYKVLSKIIRNICNCYEIKTTETDSELTEKPTQQLIIFESLPHVIKHILFGLTSVFAGLNSIHFEQNNLITKLNDKEEEEDDDEDKNETTEDNNRLIKPLSSRKCDMMLI